MPARPLALPACLPILSQPREEDFRTGAQRYRVKRKERRKSKIEMVEKLKSYIILKGKQKSPESQAEVAANH